MGILYSFIGIEASGEKKKFSQWLPVFMRILDVFLIP